jgi:hypothetical protein
MKRIFTNLLLSAVLLSSAMSVRSFADPWFPFTSSKKPRGLLGGKSSDKTVITDPSVEQASLQTRNVTIHAPSSTGPGGPNVQMVNSRSLVIEFDLKDLGTSGLGEVDLWFTRNGQTWAKSPGLPQKTSPFVVEASEDGLYGFTVVARNGLGLARPAPQPGDAPQMWVDVDTSKPEVHLLGTQAGADENGRTLTLHWSAADRNLVPRAITLSYAEKADGPWVPFAMNLANTGAYTWHVSSGLSKRLLVRVQAIDRVGNIGADQTIMPNPQDLAKPTATVRNVSRNGVLVPVNGRE